MEIEIRLKAIIEKKGIRYHGMIGDLAVFCGVNRATIRRLLANELHQPSLELLGKVCEWLVQHGVRPDTLPQALFDARPAKLWAALAEFNRVRFILGEYQQGGPVAPRRWLSTRDSAVQARLIEHLSAPKNIGGGRPPIISTEFVPFRFEPPTVFGEAPPDTEASRQQFDEDIARAKAVYERIKALRAHEAIVAIGSQRVNFLVEYLVAALFGCTPFSTPHRVAQVPFFLVYRNIDRAVPSCFGGLDNPPGYDQTTRQPGTYYRDNRNRWNLCPWVEDKADSGVIIIVYEPGLQLQMHIIGFSGRCTDAIGSELVRAANRFWPPKCPVGAKRIGVHICRLDLSPQQHSEARVSKFDVITLSSAALRRYLP